MEACRYSCQPFTRKRKWSWAFTILVPASQTLFSACAISFSCFQHCCFPSFLYSCCWSSVITACFLHFRKVYNGQDHHGTRAVISVCVQCMMVYPGAYCACGAAIPLLATQEGSVVFIKWIYGDIPLESQVLSQISSPTLMLRQFFLSFLLCILWKFFYLLLIRNMYKWTLCKYPEKKNIH